MRRESLVNARIAAYTQKKKHGDKIRKDTAINIIRDKTHHKKHCSKKRAPQRGSSFFIWKAISSCLKYHTCRI